MLVWLENTYSRSFLRFRVKMGKTETFLFYAARNAIRGVGIGGALSGRLRPQLLGRWSSVPIVCPHSKMWGSGPPTPEITPICVDDCMYAFVEEQNLSGVHNVALTC